MSFFSDLLDPLGLFDSPDPVSYPAPSSGEEQLYEEMAKTIASEREKSNDPLIREAEQMTARYTISELGDYLASSDQRKAINAQALNVYQQQLDMTSKLLSELSTTKSLAELTGKLSPEEQSMIDTMAEKSIAQLTSSVGEQFTEVLQGDIAKMAAKGILNSNIATNAINSLAKQAQKTIASGTVDIENQRMANILAIQESNKNRGMQQQQLDFSKLQLAMGGGGTSTTAGIQPVTTALNMGTNLTSSGKSSIQSAMTGSTSLAGMFAQNRAGQFQASLANQQAGLSKDQATGSAAAAAAAAAA
jgi:hypothetical protein